jgi:hypothetical protein
MPDLAAENLLNVLGNIEAKLAAFAGVELMITGSARKQLDVLESIDSIAQRLADEGAPDRSHPGYVSGRRYGPLLTQSLINNAAVTANTLYAQYTSILHPVTISGLSLRIGTAVAGVSGKMAIYSLAGAKLAEIVNDIDMNGAVGAADGLFSTNLTLPPGMYITTACFNGAAQPGTWAHNVIQAGGFAWYTGGTTFSGISTSGSSSRLTAALTYAAANSFFPAALPSLAPGTGAPGSPYMGFIVA